MKLRELVTALAYDYDEAGQRKAEQGFQTLVNRANSVVDATARIGRSLTTFVTLPLLGLAGLSVKAFDDADDAAEQLAGTFPKIAKEAAATSKEIQNSMGLAASTADTLLANTAGIIENFQFGEKATLGLSKSLITVAADLAAFKNLQGGTEAGVQILTAALAGQTRGLKQLGLVIDQQEIKERVALLLSRGQTFASQAQAEALATLQLIQERASKATGAYAKKQGDLQETMLRNYELLKDIGAGYGEILTPALNLAAHAVEGFLKWFRDLPKWVRTATLVVGGLVAALGPLLLAFAGLMKLLLLVDQIMTFVTVLEVLGVALIPVTLELLAWVAAIALVLLVLQDLYTFMQGGDSVIGRFMKKIAEWGTSVGDWAKGVADSIAKWLQPALDWITKISDKIAGFGTGIGNGLRSATSFLVPSSPVAAAGAGAGGSLSQANTIKIQVDARGNSPAETTEAVRTGVESGLGDVLRQGGQNFVPGAQY